MNRWWLFGCWVALAIWLLVSLIVIFFGLVGAVIYPIDAGIGMLGLAVVAPSALRLIRSYRLHRFDATDLMAVAFLLASLAVVFWSGQQLASPRPTFPLLG